MSKNLEELTSIIREMMLEIGELKERVFALEQSERKDADSGTELPPAESPLSEEEKMRLQGEGFENLGRLYASGYHVCQIFFGERYEGECIFCVALLEKR